MSEDGATAAPPVEAALDAAARRPGPWRRFVDRFLPADERRDALWIIGAATALATLRALLYPPLQRFVAAHVFSPRVEELGFALRATAIADVLWGIVAGLLIWLLLRFTKAPKAIALYIVLAGLLAGLVSLGGRLALNAVMELAGSEYRRAIWSDLQPIMLAAAEAVGVVVGAWLAQLASEEERPSDGSTFLPAVGWSGRPLAGATRLAVAYAVTRTTAQLAASLVTFVPQAYVLYASVRLAAQGFVLNWPGTVGWILALLVYFFAGYLGVKRFRAPVTIWLAFFAAGLPAFVSALMFVPSQLAAMRLGGAEITLLSLLPLVALPLVVLPLLGVWLATRPAHASDPSATLPGQDNDHW